MNETKKLNPTRTDYVCYYGCLFLSITTGFATLTAELGLVMATICTCCLMDTSTVFKNCLLVCVYCVMLFTAGVLSPSLRQLDKIFDTVGFNPKRVATGTTGACCGMLLVPPLALVSYATYFTELKTIMVTTSLRTFYNWCLIIMVLVDILFNFMVKVVKRRYERQGFCFKDEKDGKTKKRISRSPR